MALADKPKRSTVYLDPELHKDIVSLGFIDKLKR